MIPSPYVEYVKQHWKQAKREIAFQRKLRAAEQIYEYVVQSSKSLAVAINRNDVQVFKVNLTDKELAEIGKFLIERYGQNRKTD